MALPETVGGYTLCPRKGVMYMEYLVVMAIILLFATGYIYTVKKK